VLFFHGGAYHSASPRPAPPGPLAQGGLLCSGPRRPQAAGCSPPGLTAWPPSIRFPCRRRGRRDPAYRWLIADGPRTRPRAGRHPAGDFLKVAAWPRGALAPARTAGEPPAPARGLSSHLAVEPTLPGRPSRCASPRGGGRCCTPRPIRAPLEACGLVPSRQDARHPYASRCIPTLRPAGPVPDPGRGKRRDPARTPPCRSPAARPPGVDVDARKSGRRCRIRQRVRRAAARRRTKPFRAGVRPLAARGPGHPATGTLAPVSGAKQGAPWFGQGG